MPEQSRLSFSGRLKAAPANGQMIVPHPTYHPPQADASQRPTRLSVTLVARIYDPTRNPIFRTGDRGDRGDTEEKWAAEGRQAGVTGPAFGTYLSPVVTPCVTL